MDITLAVLCEYVTVSEAGQLSLIGMVERLRSRTWPCKCRPMHLVLRFAANPAEAGQTKKVQVVLMDQDGKPLGRQRMSISIPRVPKTGEQGRNILIQGRLFFPRLRFKFPGDYAFVVLVGGEPKATVSLELRRRTG